LLILKTNSLLPVAAAPVSSCDVCANYLFTNLKKYTKKNEEGECFTLKETDFC